VGQATPKLLVLSTQIRVSSTYFKPVSFPKRLKGKAATKLNFAPVIESEGLKEASGIVGIQADKRRSESMEISKREVKEGENQLPAGDWAEMCKKKCIICFESQSDAVFMNCGHGGICTDCSTAIWKRADVCHCCRNPIDHILHIEDTGPNAVNAVSNLLSGLSSVKRQDNQSFLCMGFCATAGLKFLCFLRLVILSLC
jgi:hypothetical protein